MRLIVLTDIDDTLMQTARKCEAAADLSVGAVGREGEAISFMTAKQRKLWAILESQADIRIPVTARSEKALSRVQFTFPYGAVTDFGATLLNDNGRPDADWLDHMRQRSKKLYQQDAFSLLMNRLTRGRDLSHHEWRVANGIHVFLSFRVPAGDAHTALVTEIESLMAHEGLNPDFYLHKTDRDITLLPRFIDKAETVRHLVEREGWKQDLVLALGDSLSDLGFMNCADYLVAPTQSRLAKSMQAVVAHEGLNA